MVVEALISILSFSPAGPALAVTSEFKCPSTHSMPGAPENSVVVLIDGEVAGVLVPGGSTVDELIDGESVAHLEIRCWNQDTDELPAPDGIPLILITSKAYAGAQRGAVEEAVAAVLAFEEGHGRTPAALDEVGLPDRPHDDAVGPSEPSAPEAATIEYLRTEDGWSVRNGGGPLAFRCSAVKSPTAEPTVGCVPTYELAKENLRARYAQGA